MGVDGDESSKMEADDSSSHSRTTLDCLRGRLRAERQASKIAKEEAHRLGLKLMEVENKLREETKLRAKAEKKLKFLTKKLESLKIEESHSQICSSSTSTANQESAALFDPQHTSSGPDPDDSHSLSDKCSSGSKKDNRSSCSDWEEAKTRGEEENADNSWPIAPVNVSEAASKSKASESMMVNQATNSTSDLGNFPNRKRVIYLSHSAQ